MDSRSIAAGRRPLLVLSLLCGCTMPVGDEVSEAPVDESEPDAEVASLAQSLVNCTPRTATGYRNGAAFTITVIEVDGKPVEVQTANHYVAMQQAAGRAGVTLAITSGFRTQAEQQRLWNCYQNCNCNNCNLAARPGYSPHQSGTALDLANTRSAPVSNWLNANARTFGFVANVAGEPWHWDWTGGGASVEACGSPVGTDNCTATERHNAAQFGCMCADHKPSGAFCDGSGCTAQETDNFAQFGCGCVDHKASGAFCDGTGCTVRETMNANAFGCQCVDHKPAGGWCDGSGCTARETDNCAQFGCGCTDHECSGIFCDGQNCTAREIDNCSKVGCGCQDHECAGGFCG